jgi:hypothetical protein
MIGNSNKNDPEGSSRDGVGPFVNIYNSMASVTVEVPNGIAHAMAESDRRKDIGNRAGMQPWNGLVSPTAPAPWSGNRSGE